MLIKTCDNKIKKAHLQRQKKNGKKQTNIQIVRRENAKNRGFLRLREIWKQGKKKERERQWWKLAERTIPFDWTLRKQHREGEQWQIIAVTNNQWSQWTLHKTTGYSVLRHSWDAPTEMANEFECRQIRRETAMAPSSDKWHWELKSFPIIETAAATAQSAS